VASRREEQVRRAEEAYGREQQLERARAGEETHAILREFLLEAADEVPGYDQGPFGPTDIGGLLATCWDAQDPKPEDPLVPKLLRAAIDESKRRQP
jgi:hypothetical protein